MQKIKKLSLDQIQKIAAGEVVERPANVIKELIENALDADATTITINIEQAGQKKIEVIDNGCGMSLTDAHACFEHHATSKLSTVDQLPLLDTFGFRGEALSSISAVSKVTLRTKTANQQAGLYIQREDNRILNEKTISRNTGTSICVEDIFYNVPARKKFLKKIPTEQRHITTLFQASCFARLDVHFKLYVDGVLLYNCPPATTFTTRALQLWDTRIADAMLELNIGKKEELKAPISLEGIISHHQYMRYDRNALFMFVNKRWVKNFELAKAVLKGYMGVLQQGRYPAAVISITIDPQELDVNIHPRKEEVSFLHPQVVQQTITRAIKNTLEDHLSTQLQKSVQLQQSTTPQYEAPYPTTPFSFDFAQPVFEKESYAIFGKAISTKEHDLQHNVTTTPIAQQEIVSPATNSANVQVDDSTLVSAYKLIGQFYNTYLLLEHQDGLFVVDQHAAHERIVYERFKQRFGSPETVPLMFPTIIQLRKDEHQTICEYKELFEEHGIHFEDFGNAQLRITATPVHAQKIPLDTFMRDVTSWIEEHRNIEKEEFFKLLNERMHAQMACKAAIRAGDHLSQEQMKQLLNDLEITPNRLTCPHGRPTGWLLSMHDIEKKFKRKL